MIWREAALETKKRSVDHNSACSSPLPRPSRTDIDGSLPSEGSYCARESKGTGVLRANVDVPGGMGQNGDKIDGRGP